MAEKPVVQDSAGSLRRGLIVLALSPVAWIVGAATRTEPLGMVALVLLMLGVIWVVQSLVAGARNRDAMARALLEQRDEPRRES